MTTLWPDISPTLVALTLVGVTGGMLLLLLVLALRQAMLWRRALRTMTRRPAQALLLLCGLVLSSVVITASFGLQDSFADSTLTQRLAAMGRVDESVTGTFTPAQVTTALASLRHAPTVQAATGLIFYSDGANLSSLRTGLTLHNVDLYALPPDFERVYGPLSDLHGQRVLVARLRPNEVVLSATTARAFAVGVGERIRVDLGATTITSTVRAILATDLGITTGEAVQAGSLPEVILPLGLYQHIYERLTHQPQPPNTLCVAARDADTRPAVVRLLERLFPDGIISLSATSGRLGRIDVDLTKIHPMQPDVAHVIALQVTKVVFLSAVGQQFVWLPPLFTLLLVGAGMLFLFLLMIMMAAERRPELGMSRALGFQRRHLVQLLLFEGVGYGVVATLVGVVLGVGATALELAVLAHLPQLGPGESGSNAVAIPVIVPLHLWLSWQSLLSAWCLGVLATAATVLAAALGIGRTSIVAAMRDLDDQPAPRVPLQTWVHLLWKAPSDEDLHPLPETPARRRVRRGDAMLGLVWGMWGRGPLGLVVGATILAWGTAAPVWLHQVGVTLAIAGCALLATWLADLGIPSAAGRAVARRLALSLIGLGWLVSGLGAGNAFLALFQPVVTFSGPPSALEILVDMLLPVVGAVFLLMTNADLLATLATSLLRQVPGLAPISRASLAYPLIYRFRTGVTVALLGVVTFLVVLLVAINLSAIQEAQAAGTTGGFQLQAVVYGSQQRSSNGVAARLQALSAHRLLRTEIAAVGLLRLLYDLPAAGVPPPIRLGLTPPATYPLNRIPLVADEGFLSATTMPVYARAQGFASDRQVWDTLRTRPGTIVLQYDPRVTSLPTTSGFRPFTVDIPDSAAPTAGYHQVTVIGLLAATAPWRVLLSVPTAARIAHPAYIPFINTYLFQLAPGTAEEQAARNLSDALRANATGITVQSLDHSDQNGITAVFTLFLGGDLALGLLFGALAIGVITGRAVVERRQQIGMLRALGFSRALVRRAFLLESSSVISLGLLVGAALALGLASWVGRATAQALPLPLRPIALILAGSYAIALVGTLWPARQAARLPPAEALRYE